MCMGWQDNLTGFLASREAFATELGRVDPSLLRAEYHKVGQAHARGFEFFALQSALCRLGGIGCVYVRPTVHLFGRESLLAMTTPTLKAMLHLTREEYPAVAALLRTAEVAWWPARLRRTWTLFEDLPAVKANAAAQFPDLRDWTHPVPDEVKLHGGRRVGGILGNETGK